MRRANRDRDDAGRDRDDTSNGSFVDGPLVNRAGTVLEGVGCLKELVLAV